MNKLTLARYGIEPSIVIPETMFFTLSIENKDFLLSVLKELRLQIEDGKEDGPFYLVLNEKGVDIEKSMDIIFDFTNINFNTKSIANLLIKKFSQFLGLGEQLESLEILEGSIVNLAENFRLKSGLNVEYDAVMSGSNIAKMCSLKIADHDCPLLERLWEYINLLCDLKPLKLFILVFGKAFLTPVDIHNLYQHCFDKHVRLMFIESTDKMELMPKERRLIIDKDFCSIVQGYDEEGDNEY